MTTRTDRPTSVAIVTLGCARNEVDSDELAARLEADGLRLVDTPDDADAVLVNTCGFIEQAKQESIATLLDVGTDDEADGGSRRAVVAVVLARWARWWRTPRAAR